MTACKWNAEKGDYLTPDGDLCRHDDYGDPTRHCTARRTCSQHIGARELTCATCLGRARQTIRKIRDHAPLLPTAAELEEWGRRAVQGVNSEVAWLAGPAADTEAWSWRKVTARQGGPWHVSLPCQLDHVHRKCDAEDDDDWHPYTVLTRWEFMLREDYRQPRATPTSITSAADYLDRILAKVAQDDGQDFPLLLRELRTCWNRMEMALAVKRWTEHGAPCPECVEAGTVDPSKVRLVRKFGHWCTDEGCERLHYMTDEADRWVCPHDSSHWWTAEGYANLMDERATQRA